MVSLVEDVQYLDCVHYYVLFKNVFDDNDCDVRLELQDRVEEEFLGQAMSKCFSGEIFELLVGCFSSQLVANLEAFQDLFKDWEVAKFIDLGKEQ